jgi:hypothetical protein
MALDYLPIQATFVPCKRTFSSSAETDTKKCNCIKYDFMEALQILKFRFKKEQLNFTADILTTPEDLTSVSPDIVAKDPLAECLKGKRREATNDANAQQLFNWNGKIK